MSAETLSAADRVAQARQGIAPFFPRWAVPTAADTAQAKKDAQGVLDWLRGNLAKHRDSADMARDFEHLLFNIGSIRMLWALLPNENEVGRYLVEREALLMGTPLVVRAAPARAEHREHEERAAMFETVHNLRMTADRLQSERLSKAADVFEQMQGFFRVEPETPARNARKEPTDKGRATKDRKREATKTAMVELYKKGYTIDENGNKRAFKSATDAAQLLRESAIAEAEKNKYKMSNARIVQTVGDWFREYDRLTASTKR